MKVLEGQLSIQGKKIAIVAGRFNSLITKQLIEGARDGLVRSGVSEEDITLAWVPGAYEIPLIAKKFAEKSDIDAVICLGAVIRGATAHFEYVAGEVAKGVSRVGLESGKPVMFGVLTVDTIEQALERAGTKAGNNGFAAAMGVVEMLSLIDEII
ncbi:6,7-dimethyl-8-ribityllumazine synthase [Ignatzschineria indica]|uniref:6,7-dimethyl-8-ribityllumazine synthase n=1 Tax=Ignatzschineria indica TaxID=472583 RepID=A0A2U2ALX1_9GAMM|nr:MULTISPECIES: 6,7-dimethyl-8-ribityllumazine synthase [Ignatzschineria]OYQ78683.1 6,7-dimethyl-8-ribityllumazine synthase [Ignatzschineria sp. F8392]PWD84223.1 6,7-dimethyl-8-ribityllumazine synthase [Ignatzschineria indica]GGZ74836.1 6,7-dimethyl-8-ribityllumazine synthase [Ignatzschineria indica]